MNGLALRFAIFGTVALLPLTLGAQMSNDPNGGMMNPAQPAPATMGNPPNVNTGGTPLSSTNTNSMRDSLGAPGLTGREMRDQEFLRTMTEDDLVQVEFGKLAEQKGSPEVKQFAERMVQDHTAINTDMTTVADQLGVMVPRKLNRQNQQEYDKLSSLSGSDFDREYILLMVRDHREDLHQLRLESMNATDQSLQSEIAKAAPVVREHMRLSIELAQQKGIPVPPRPPRPGSAPPPPPPATPPPPPTL